MNFNKHFKYQFLLITDFLIIFKDEITEEIT